MKTIVGSKTLIFQKPLNVLAKIAFFEGRRVIQGSQNRPKEDRRGDKEALRGSVNRKKREEDTRRAVEEDRERDKQRQGKNPS